MGELAQVIGTFRADELLDDLVALVRKDFELWDAETAAFEEALRNGSRTSGGRMSFVSFYAYAFDTSRCRRFTPRY